MNYLRVYEDHSNEKLKKLCKIFDLENYSINPDGTVEVNGNVDLSHHKTGSKIHIKFRRVTKNFNCMFNSLKSLENSPVYIDGNLICCYNKLTTLLKGPLSVGGRYDCSNNHLRDVYGFPKNFEGIIRFDNNPVCEILNLIAKGDHINYDEMEKKIKFIKLLNEYQVIRNEQGNNLPSENSDFGYGHIKNSMIESRFMDVLYEVGINKLKKKFKFYKLI